jgi:NADPH:quinone reductase-like Zn-dependent oxidoreductase
MMERVVELGASAVILSAATSQLARMMIRICLRDNVTPICIVRKAEQVQFLKDEVEGCQYVFNSTDENFLEQMKECCAEKNPTVALECIGGDFTGLIMSFLPARGTCIVYGSLSFEHCRICHFGNFEAMKKIEGFNLGQWMAEKSKDPATMKAWVGKIMPLYKSILTTHVQARFGLH